MSPRTKPLTEGGSVFNLTGGKLRPSAEQYANSLANFFLMKEIKEYLGRFQWDGLPEGLNSNILETMLYYKGQLAFFKIASQYYILPFVYTGKINHYGIQEKLIPISFNGTVEDDKNKTTHFAGEKIAYVYKKAGMDAPLEDVAVVLKAGSSLYLNQAIAPIIATDELRNKLVENLILIRYNLILGQPMKYVSVPNESAAKSLQTQVDNLIYDILNGNVINTVVGSLTFTDINSEPSKLAPQQLWQSFASLDNLRMEYLGILNNGVFEKRERNLSDEVAGKQTVAKLTLADDLMNRMIWCKLVNLIYGLKITVKVNPMLEPEKEKEDTDKREGKDNANVQADLPKVD
jgi:hypothetical protein